MRFVCIPILFCIVGSSFTGRLNRPQGYRPAPRPEAKLDALLSKMGCGSMGPNDQLIIVCEDDVPEPQVIHNYFYENAPSSTRRRIFKLLGFVTVTGLLATGAILAAIAGALASGGNMGTLVNTASRLSSSDVTPWIPNNHVWNNYAPDMYPDSDAARISRAPQTTWNPVSPVWNHFGSDMHSGDDFDATTRVAQPTFMEELEEVAQKYQDNPLVSEVMKSLRGFDFSFLDAFRPYSVETFVDGTAGVDDYIGADSVHSDEVRADVVTLDVDAHILDASSNVVDASLEVDTPDVDAHTVDASSNLVDASLDVVTPDADAHVVDARGNTDFANTSTISEAGSEEQTNGHSPLRDEASLSILQLPGEMRQWIGTQMRARFMSARQCRELLQSVRFLCFTFGSSSLQRSLRK